MSGGRRGQWPPPHPSHSSTSSTTSSPASGPGNPGYIDQSQHPNGAYRAMSNGRVPPNARTFPNQTQQHQAAAQGNAAHISGPYGGPTTQQSSGMHHIDANAYQDPLATGHVLNQGPSSFYGGYGQPQGVQSNSFPSSNSPFNYTSPTADGKMHQPHQSQHMLQADQSHPFHPAPWMGSASAQSPFHNAAEAARFNVGKASPFGHPAGSQFKPSDGYMQPLNSMDGMMYPGQMYQSDAGRDLKAEAEDEEIDGEDAGEDGEVTGAGKKGKGQSQKGTSEFVKKLFRMLDDTSYSSIVSWSPTGDSFIVKDMNDFTKHVLPRHFRHSNFASFVRQLNKYDFHKVKKPDESGQQPLLGVDQMWEFRHPAFLQHREDMLENVKRKVPTGKKLGKKDGEDVPSRDQSPTMPGAADAADKGAEEYTKLKEQVATLTASQDLMSDHINNLTKQYQGVIGEMLTFQKNMVQQDQLMQNLIQYLMNLEADRKLEAGPSHPAARGVEGSSRPQLENNDAFVSSRDAERLVTNFSDVAKESFSQMSELAHRAALGGDAGSLHGSKSSAAGAPSQVPYSESRSSMTSNHQGGLSPKSVASYSSPQSSTFTDKGKGKPLVPEGQIPSVFFHPPHHDMGGETVANASGRQQDILSAAANAVSNPSLAGFEGAGLRVFTVGTLQPRSNAESTGLEPDGSTPATAALEKAFLRSSSSTEGEEAKPFGISVPNLESLPAGMPKVDGRTTSQRNTPKAQPAPLAGNEETEETSTPSEAGGNMLRVRRSTYIPGWAVPPKVLVVDDDDVCRKLGSKFLQVFGCAIDVAVDGVTAVNKMNLEKYDLVLMDIVMPNLDGVSATSLIREFDPRTPIISMTSNSAPNELLSYMSSGMNDVLPKPFTKEGLLNMLEKHLIHLKTVQKMDEIPKALGLPPISDDMMQNVLSATAASANSMGGSTSSSGRDGSANPMAAMMGNGPHALRASQEADNGPHDFRIEDDDGIVNPLAGMGFSDEEYISMLQNLLAAGSVSDSIRGESVDTVASVMGVTRGEGVAAGSRSKESTPVVRTGTKRSADSGPDPSDGKRSRFTELQV